MDAEPTQPDPVDYLVAEMEGFILRMAAEIDRLRARVEALETQAVEQRSGDR